MSEPRARELVCSSEGEEAVNQSMDLPSDPEALFASSVTAENSFGSQQENVPLMDPLNQSSSGKFRCCSGKLNEGTFRKVLGWIKTNLLLILTIASVLVGAILGISVREVNIPHQSQGYRLMVELLGFPGEIFLRMLKMLILPLIVFSLIAGLGSLETKVAGSLGWKTVLYYTSTTVTAVILGLILVNSIKPGGRTVVAGCDNSTLHSTGNNLDVIHSVLDLLRNMVPDNLFTATFQQAETHYEYENVTNFDKCMTIYNLTRSDLEFFDNSSNNSFTCSQIEQFFDDTGLSCENATEYDRRYVLVGKRDGMNVLGIIVFTIAFGITLGRLGAEGRRLVNAIGVLNDGIMRLVSLVMWYSPIGIASIITAKMAEVEDFSVLVEEIGLYFTTVMLGLAIHGCIFLPLLYTVMTRSNPFKIIRAVLQALVTAFGTSSSSATLPITIQNLEKNFNADSRVTRFMLPVGATINMDGTALYEAVAAVFIAQVQGVQLSIPKMIIISITATCASIGAAGVPQAGLFTLVVVLVAVGLNPDDVALILAVDWLLDRFRTTVNVLGDTFGVGIVQYYSKKQLGHLPDHATPPQQAGEGDENSADSATNSNREGAHSPDYGASSSSPPPPTLPHIPTPQWSVRSSSLDSTHDQQRSDASSNSERRIAAGSTYQKIREETVL